MRCGLVLAGCAERIEGTAVHAFKSVPKRGAEGGGILCGRFDETAGKRGIRIDSIVPVRVAYRFGPTWKLSDRDLDNLRTAITAAASRHVIGWYRSHARQTPSPDPEDFAITQEFFGGDSPVI